MACKHNPCPVICDHEVLVDALVLPTKRRWYRVGPDRGFLVDIIDDTPDDDYMIKVRRVVDGQITWVYPRSLSTP